MRLKGAIMPSPDQAGHHRTLSDRWVPMAEARVKMMSQ